MAVGARSIELHGLAVEGRCFAHLALLSQRIAEVIQRLHVARIESQRLAVARDRLGTLSAAGQQQAKVVVRHGEAGCQRNRPPAARQRLLELADLAQRVGEIAQHLWVLGSALECLPVAAPCCSGLVELEESISQVVVPLGTARVELQRTLVERHRLARAAAGPFGIGGVDERPGVAGFKRKRAMQARERRRPLTAGLELRAEVGMRFGVLRQQLRCAL